MLKAVTEFMLDWAEWLIGLVPFALVALLLWIRLQAAGAPPQLAARTIFGLFVWVGLVILGIAVASSGWRAGNSWSLVSGALVTVASLMILRQRLQRLWKEFPLLPTENEDNQDKGHNACNNEHEGTKQR